MTDTIRTTTFAIVPEWLIFADISDRAVRLYAVLHRKADSDGTSAFPSRRWLAERLSCSTSSVDRALDELVGVDAIVKRERRRPDGSRTSNEYLVRFDDPSSPVSRGVPNGDQGASSPVSRGVPTRDEASTESPYTESPETENESTAVAVVADDPFPDVATEQTIGHARELCREFAGYVRDNGHALPARGSSAADGWLTEMERLVRIGPPGNVDWHDDPDDAVDEIGRVMRWALTVSDFWPANVQSVPTFRSKFTRLRAQADRRNGGRSSDAAKAAKYQRLAREGLT